MSKDEHDGENRCKDAKSQSSIIESGNQHKKRSRQKRQDNARKGETKQSYSGRLYNNAGNSSVRTAELHANTEVKIIDHSEAHS